MEREGGRALIIGWNDCIEHAHWTAIFKHSALYTYIHSKSNLNFLRLRKTDRKSIRSRQDLKEHDQIKALFGNFRVSLSLMRHVGCYNSHSLSAMEDKKMTPAQLSRIFFMSYLFERLRWQLHNLPSTFSSEIQRKYSCKTSWAQIKQNFMRKYNFTALNPCHRIRKWFTGDK